jgi:hypothetical protein
VSTFVPGTQFFPLVVSVVCAFQIVTALRKPSDWPPRKRLLLSATIGFIAGIVLCLWMSTLIGPA